MIKVSRSVLLAVLLGGSALVAIAWAQRPDESGPRATPPAAAPHVPQAQPSAHPAHDPFAKPRFGDQDAKVHAPPADDDDQRLAPDARPGFIERTERFGGPKEIRRGGLRVGKARRPVRLVPKVRTVVEMVREPIPEAELADAEAFGKAVQTLKSSPEGPQREAAKTALRQLLEKAFARDLERREKEFSDVEARVKKLREQLEKRKKNKEAIVDLRLMTIVNESEGLEFPTPFGSDQPGPPGFDPRFKSWYESKVGRVPELDISVPSLIPGEPMGAKRPETIEPLRPPALKKPPAAPAVPPPGTKDTKPREIPSDDLKRVKEKV